MMWRITPSWKVLTIVFVGCLSTPAFAGFLDLTASTTLSVVGSPDNVITNTYQSQTAPPPALDQNTVQSSQDNGVVSASASASANLINGVVTALATSTQALPDAASASTGQAALGDTTHWASVDPNGFVDIPVAAHLDGVTNATGDVSALSVVYQLTFGTASLFYEYAVSNSQTGSIITDGPPLANGWQTATFTNVGTGGLDFAGTFRLFGSQSPDISVIESLAVGVGAGGSADYTHTAFLTITAPAGTSFTSDSGVFLTQAPPEPTGVPEPGSLALIGSGFPLIGWLRRKRWNRVRAARPVIS